MFNIRKIAMVTMALGLVAAPALAENPMTGEAQMTEEYSFSEYDENQDNLVTEEEFAKNMDETLSQVAFGDFDIDADGALTETEFSELSRAAVNRNTSQDYYSQ